MKEDLFGKLRVVDDEIWMTPAQGGMPPGVWLRKGTIVLVVGEDLILHSPLRERRLIILVAGQTGSTRCNFLEKYTTLVDE